MSSFARNSLTVFSSDVFSAGLKFFASVIIARVLGSEEQGVYSIATQIVTFALMFGSMGLEIALIYFIGQRKYPVKDIVGNSFLIVLLSSSCLFFLLYLINPFLIEKFLQGKNVSVVYIAELAIIFMMIQSLISGVMLGQNKVLEYSLLKIVRPFVFIVFIIILLIGLNFDIEGTIVAYTAASFCAMLVGFYMLSRGNNLSIPIYSKEITKDCFKYSIRGYFGSLTQYLNYRLDIFLVAYFLSPSHVGYYIAAMMIAEIIWFIPNSISVVLLPKSASSNIEKNNEHIPIISRNTLLLTLVVSFAIFIGSGFLINIIFGSSYFSSVTPLRLLLPGIVALSLWKIMANDMAGRGFPQYKSYSAGIAFAGTVLLDFVLIPKFGINGAAIASSAAYILSTIAMSFWFCRVTGLKMISLIVPSMDDVRMYLTLILRITDMSKKVLHGINNAPMK